MARLLFLALAALGVALIADARAQQPISRDLPALLSADEVEFNEDLGVVVASGNVEISQNDRVLMADRISYNQRTRIITATGSVSLLEPDGNVLFAEYLEITDDMRDGIARNLSLLLTDDSRFAAAGGGIRNGTETILNKAVYSPCKLCEDDPTKPPLWQIKAVRVVHDTDSHDIRYRDAWLEMWGVPVAYTPYLSHPDPTVERRSGFLAPVVGSDSVLGFVARTPYFFDIAEDKDATLEPIFTTKERIALAGEYRQRFATGELEADGSITRVRRRADDAEALDDDITRGHFFSIGRFRFGPHLALGLRRPVHHRRLPICVAMISAPRTRSRPAHSSRAFVRATTPRAGPITSAACAGTTTPS